MHAPALLSLSVDLPLLPLLPPPARCSVKETSSISDQPTGQSLSHSLLCSLHHTSQHIKVLFLLPPQRHATQLRRDILCCTVARRTGISLCCSISILGSSVCRHLLRYRNLSYQDRFCRAMLASVECDVCHRHPSHCDKCDTYNIDAGIWALLLLPIPTFPLTYRVPRVTYHITWNARPERRETSGTYRVTAAGSK
jgi:hypothetical protein